MTNKALIEKLSRETGLPQEEVQLLINTLGKTIESTVLESSEPVKVTNFGVFYPVDYQKNKFIRFRMSRRLYGEVRGSNGGDGEGQGEDEQRGNPEVS